MKDHHHINDEEYIRTQTKSNRIGRNGQCGFWCGFCCEIVTLKKRGLEAWDERFSHIDDLHFKKGQTIDLWVPLDKEIPKGFPRIHSQVVDECPTSPSPPPFEDEEESAITSSEHSPREEEINGSTTPQQSPRRARSRNPSPLRTNATTTNPFVTVLASSISEHEQRQRTPPSQKKGTRPTPPRQIRSRWYCCACLDGPHYSLIDSYCSTCMKKRCESCTAE